MSEEQKIDPEIFSDLVPVKALSPDHCQELALKSKMGQIGSGKVLIKQGEDNGRIIYVLKGAVEISGDGVETRTVTGGSKQAKMPLDQSKVARCTATTKTDVLYLSVDANLLDIMLTWEQSGGYEVQDLQDDQGDEDWMSKILQAKVFHKIPPANIQSVFMRMKETHFKAGEPVIKQGGEGDTFYIIREGNCRVIRQTKKAPQGMVLANLQVGDNFGEEALISGGKRNASVVMASDGVLMSLSKDDFLELLNEPLLKSISYDDARAEGGAVWLDVRLPQEYQTRHIKGSVNLPLPLIRARLDKLDPDRKYIVCCDTGRRSSTATYILSQHSLDASVLDNGLDGVPQEHIEAAA
ncbi:MAG: cyclic nucleotide-binding domain-containing protein [Gammaproteobacteria bacterium]|nr:cyclic nucleotide-binding domain-containing protein [Gammaproteobacteria bacterium]MDH5803391.1 cyclic nucleotide-binding domain-containing protein [Gammaproteobacteria bacterium]